MLYTLVALAVGLQKVTRRTLDAAGLLNAANRPADRVGRPRRRRAGRRGPGDAPPGGRRAERRVRAREWAKDGWRASSPAPASTSNTSIWTDPFRRRAPDRWRRPSAAVASTSHTATSSRWRSTARGPPWLAGGPHVITMHGSRYYAAAAAAARRDARRRSRSAGGPSPCPDELASHLSRDLLVAPSAIATIPNGVRAMPAGWIRGARRAAARSRRSAGRGDREPVSRQGRMRT